MITKYSACLKQVCQRQPQDSHIVAPLIAQHVDARGVREGSEHFVDCVISWWEFGLLGFSLSGKSFSIAPKFVSHYKCAATQQCHPCRRVKRVISDA